MKSHLSLADVAVIILLYLLGFRLGAGYAATVGESWLTLNLPILGVIVVGEGLWFIIRRWIGEQVSVETEASGQPAP